jgi:hypothetical protein
MSRHATSSALALCSLTALLALGACGSSSPPAKGSQAGNGGGHAGAGGASGSGGLGPCAGASGCPGPTGPDGATLSMPGVDLAVPAGALATDTMITISSTTAPAGYEVTSQAFQFLPAGTTFAKPVTVTIQMDLASPDAHIFWSNASGGFDDIGGTVNGNVITGQVTHFSIGFAAVPKADGGAPDAPMMMMTGTDGGAMTDVSALGGSSGGAGGSAAGGAGGVTAVDGSAAASSGGDASVTSDASAAIDASASADGGAGAGGGAVDASAGIDAASLCASFALNAPVLQPMLVTDGGTAPAGSTYTGGTIPSAQIYLNGVTHYGSAYGGPAQEVLVYDGAAHTLRIIDRLVNVQGLVYVGLENVTNADAHTLVGDVVCSTYPNQPAQMSWYYTVAGTTLTMTRVGSADVMTYILP